MNNDFEYLLVHHLLGNSILELGWRWNMLNLFWKISTWRFLGWNGTSGTYSP